MVDDFTPHQRVMLDLASAHLSPAKRVLSLLAAWDRSPPSTSDRVLAQAVAAVSVLAEVPR